MILTIITDFHLFYEFCQNILKLKVLAWLQ